jgi:cytochrome c-type protein NapC
MGFKKDPNNSAGKLRRPVFYLSILGVVFLFLLGAFFASSTFLVVHITTTQEFCISCHEMRDFAYEEYKQTKHYKNDAGVQAKCADCHVPKSFFPLVKSKILAADDLWGSITGIIDTQEKYDARKLYLAKKVWHKMKETDSRECRSCHNVNNMILDNQDQSAKTRHTEKYMKENNKTCIDCHKGVAHKMPLLKQ